MEKRHSGPFSELRSDRRADVVRCSLRSSSQRAPCNTDKGQLRSFAPLHLVHVAWPRSLVSHVSLPSSRLVRPRPAPSLPPTTRKVYHLSPTRFCYLHFQTPFVSAPHSVFGDQYTKCCSQLLVNDRHDEPCIIATLRVFDLLTIDIATLSSLDPPKLHSSGTSFTTDP